MKFKLAYNRKSHRNIGIKFLFIGNCVVMIGILMLICCILHGRARFFVTVIQEDGRKLLVKENTEFYCHENLLFLLPEIEQGYYVVIIDGKAKEKITSNKFVFVYSDCEIKIIEDIKDKDTKKNDPGNNTPENNNLEIVNPEKLETEKEEIGLVETELVATGKNITLEFVYYNNTIEIFTKKSQVFKLRI
jgi:hypothetical protein